jgi:translation initiation factor 4A
MNLCEITNDTTIMENDVEVPDIEVPDVEAHDVEAQEAKTWDDLQIDSNILRAIYTHGFENPSEIQRKAIPPMKGLHDLIAQAQSGTGKTGAFVIGSLSHVEVAKNNTQVIVLAPTHELATQIFTVFTSLSSYMNGIIIRKMVGGTSVAEDMQDLRNNIPHVVVGCTGRVFDMIKRRAISTRDVKLCVLDEADEMLSIGFKDQIYNIFQQLPSNVQIALFSATMPPAILQLTSKFMRDPVTITMQPQELNLEGIKQYYVAMNNDYDKLSFIKDLFSRLTISQTIIYANDVRRVKDLYEMMTTEGFAVCCIHREMTKQERSDTISHFKGGKYRMLISSNITARGIDVQQVNTVINFDIPRSVDTYLHRIGRSGRWGRKGIAINFVTKHDIRQMKMIESHYGANIEEMPFNMEFD